MDDLYFDDWGTGSDLSFSDVDPDYWGDWGYSAIDDWSSPNGDLGSWAYPDTSSWMDSPYYDPYADINAPFQPYEQYEDFFQNPNAVAGYMTGEAVEPPSGIMGALGQMGNAISSSFQRDPLTWLTTGAGLGLGLYTGKKQQDYYKKMLEEEKKRREAAAARQARVDRPLTFEGPETPIRTANFAADYANYGRGPEHQFITGGPQISRATFAGAKGGALASLIQGPGGGQDDNVIGRLSPGEYVIPADVVSDLGDGSNSAGAEKLDKFMGNVRSHKGRPKNLPPKAKPVKGYLK